MLPILSRHLNLVETRVCIEERQKVTPGGGVHNLIDAWKRIGVSMTCLVEVGVVDAHPKLPVRLGDDDGIGQPLGVVDLLDEVSVQQFVYLFTDEVLPLHGLLLWLLTHRFCVRVDLQLVLNHFPRDPRHL